MTKQKPKDWPDVPDYPELWDFLGSDDQALLYRDRKAYVPSPRATAFAYRVCWRVSYPGGERRFDTEEEARAFAARAFGTKTTPRKESSDEDRNSEEPNK